MKFVIGSLKVGDRIVGRVAEVIDATNIIISFGGDLIRVHNESRRSFKAGDKVDCYVTGTQPLAFRLIPTPSRTPGRFDISV